MSAMDGLGLAAELTRAEKIHNDLLSQERCLGSPQAELMPYYRLLHLKKYYVASLPRDKRDWENIISAASRAWPITNINNLEAAMTELHIISTSLRPSKQERPGYIQLIRIDRKISWRLPYYLVVQPGTYRADQLMTQYRDWYAISYAGCFLHIYPQDQITVDDRLELYITGPGPDPCTWGPVQYLAFRGSKTNWIQRYFRHESAPGVGLFRVDGPGPCA
jgi:hypothetical protein